MPDTSWRNQSLGPNSGTMGEDTVSRIFRAASGGCEIGPGARHGKRRRECRDLVGAVGHRGRLADLSWCEPYRSRRDVDVVRTRRPA
jgi:hypothetical protein